MPGCQDFKFSGFHLLPFSPVLNARLLTLVLMGGQIPTLGRLPLPQQESHTAVTYTHHNLAQERKSMKLIEFKHRPCCPP